jgi:hypothetical protein
MAARAGSTLTQDLQAAMRQPGAAMLSFADRRFEALVAGCRN